jgi:hypothetical protein
MALVNNQFLVAAAISAGGSLSAEVGIAPYTLVGVASDANWTPENISFLTSLDGTHWLTVQTDAGALSYGTLQTSSFMALDPAIFRGVQAIQVQSAANQSNTTTLTLVCQSIL